MVSPKELRERATIRKAEIEAEEREKKEKKEKRTQQLVSQNVRHIESQMQQAAEQGKFSVEVEVSGDDEVRRRIEVAFSQYKPKWYGDGYTKEYINLSW